MLCCRNRIWAFSFGCVGFYRCLYPSRSLLFNLYWRLASQLFFKVEWRNSYWLQCVGYSGEARSEKGRGSEEMLWLCPCVQMPLFNACGFHLVPADCCNCKIDPYVTSQPLPKESSLESLDSRKKYFPAWCCRELFFLWKDLKSDLLPMHFRSTERTAQLPQRRQLFQIYLLGLLRRWEGAIWTAEINVATSKSNVCARRITTGLSKIVVCCVCTT